MYVSIELFQKYSNVYSDNELQKSYINAAEDIVFNYLQYNPFVYTYNYTTDTLEDNKSKEIVNNISGVLIDFSQSRNISGIALGISGLIDNEDLSGIILEISGITNEGITGGNVTSISGLAGGISGICTGSGSEVPEIIIMTILRIATLLQSEADSNIGVTSKSFGESGGRTFINYVNYDKYLIPISKYKRLKI